MIQSLLQSPSVKPGGEEPHRWQSRGGHTPQRATMQAERLGPEEKIRQETPHFCSTGTQDHCIWIQSEGALATKAAASYRMGAGGGGKKRSQRFRSPELRAIKATSKLPIRLRFGAHHSYVRSGKHR